MITLDKESEALLSDRARELRRSMTKEERHLWYDFLKALSVPGKRQRVFGRYIGDFYIPAAALVIELDGSQHYEDEGKRADTERDEYLRSQGLTVLRYSNREVDQEFRAVCEDILTHFKPSPTGGRWRAAPDEGRNDH